MTDPANEGISDNNPLNSDNAALKELLRENLEEVSKNFPEEVVREREWVRCTDEFDPDRCQGVVRQGGNPQGGNQGQCWFKRCPPSMFCQRHTNPNLIEQEKKEKIRNYRLRKWRERVNQFADNPEVKSLREEIGIIRLMIEELLEKCETATDLILYSGKIQSLIQQVQKLVVDCHKLEQSTGVLLDKQSILVVCDGLVKIIANHVSDSDVLEIISVQMVELVAKIGGLDDVTENAPSLERAN